MVMLYPRSSGLEPSQGLFLTAPLKSIKWFLANCWSVASIPLSHFFLLLASNHHGVCIEATETWSFSVS